MRHKSYITVNYWVWNKKEQTIVYERVNCTRMCIYEYSGKVNLKTNVT